MRIGGVDPGCYGALAFLDADGSLEVVDMPRLMVKRGKSEKAHIDGLRLWSILTEANLGHVGIEQVGGLPGQSASAAFNFGDAAGAPKWLSQAAGIAVSMVPPLTWKKALRVTGGKDAAVARASALFPAHAHRWTEGQCKGSREQREGRAEAALVAEYTRRQLGGAQGAPNDIFG